MKMITISQFKKLKFKNKNPNQVDENIGKNLYEKLKEKVDLKNKKILILCGNTMKGHWGLIMAHYLREDYNLSVIFLDKKEDLDEDFKVNYFKVIGNIKQDQNLIFNSDIIIDAMLGNEVQRFIREPFKGAILKYNSSKSFKVAIDYPSGLNPDNGLVIDTETKNDLILTVHDTKRGLLDYKNVEIVKSDLE
jgi:ADP-dependent NAD(P)H-hydrate dehydratase / NAD(P)H-hydrate epimerase